MMLRRWETNQRNDDWGPWKFASNFHDRRTQTGVPFIHNTRNQVAEPRTYPVPNAHFFGYPVECRLGALVQLSGRCVLLGRWVVVDQHTDGAAVARSAEHLHAVAGDNQARLRLHGGPL